MYPAFTHDCLGCIETFPKDVRLSKNRKQLTVRVAECRDDVHAISPNPMKTRKIPLSQCYGQVRTAHKTSTDTYDQHFSCFQHSGSLKQTSFQMLKGRQENFRC